MFAVPKNPPQKLLYSKEFIRDVKGFLRCLEKLLAHPRTSRPENYYYVYSLITYYTAIVNTPDVPSTKENVELLKQGLVVCKWFEDIVARTIPGGKTIVEAMEDIQEERRRSNP
ncbi:hypothetical protein B9Z55_026566 [Caenorhabditis nigoni]|uniref:Uncharacterized protein n=1 Tax=Caenorhabditis nigoni TaxID=1611254 RepID=A0A2G5T486_9PELO|nr:hypothetical protein B9Z55_026566 [Caenorhabditis nigoni]